MATIETATDDYALESVPQSARQGWVGMAWGTTGIVTTLVGLFVGALTTFVAGIELALIAGVIVMLVGGSFGWALGHVASRTGLSSTVIARRHGFGARGAAIPAAIFAFMIIGFIAIENLLLYKGLLFAFGLGDTMALRALIYGAFTLIWIGLTLYGFRLVTRTASFSLVAFLAVLIYMMVRIVGGSGFTLAEVAGFPTQLPAQALTAMGITGAAGKLFFCINLMVGQAGALALIDADLGRYARRSRDIGIAAYLGGLFMNVLMVAAGGIIMYAGMPTLVAYYTQTAGVGPDEARRLALESPDQVASAFIVFGGVIGAALMAFAQLKAQVLNTYSSSLSLTNFCDAAFGWRPGRLIFVIGANLLSLLFLFGDALGFFNAFLSVLGVLTTCLVTVMVADYFIARPVLERRGGLPETESINWAGPAALVLGFAATRFAPAALLALPFVVAVGTTFLAYLGLRLVALPMFSRRPAISPG